MPHEPERTCAGCREKAPKRELLRMVASAQGVRLDPIGAAPGRGTYLHRSAECARAGLQRGAVARALRASMSAEEASNLLREIEREDAGRGVSDNR